MASRRMFSMRIVDTDAFLEMPLSSQALYFHLAMRADDDGFIANPKKIMRMLGNQDDEYKVLAAKKFIIPFENGVCVIKHWLIHNLIRGDRYTPTQWSKEKSKLIVDDETKKYSLNDGTHPIKSPQTQLIESGNVENPTPGQIAKLFFESSTFRISKVMEFGYKVGSDIDKFVSYWTEPNKSGTRVRWEQEKTFDVRRRLDTWMARSKEWRKPNDFKKSVDEVAGKFRIGPDGQRQEFIPGQGYL